MSKIHGVTWLLIRAGRVLLEKCPKKAAKLGVGEWFVPGGKVEGDETTRDACMREIGEEWPTVDLIDLRPLPIIEGSRVGVQVDGEDVFLMRPYLVRVRGSIPFSSADGIELRWVAIGEALSSPVPQVRMMVAAAVADLGADTERLDWLDEGNNFYLVTPATNMIGVPKGWTHRVGRSLDSIGERCLDIRDAIDKARRTAA